MRFFAAIAAFAFALMAGAPASAAENPCAVEGACRDVGVISLPDGKGGMRPLTVGRTLPWMAENNLMLFAGDTVVVSVPEQGEELETTIVATGATARTRTLAAGELRLEFTSDKDGMTLTVTSAHSRWLHYMAMMVTPDGKPHRTSVCPVMAGKMAFETWPHPIVYLNVAHFKPVKEGDLTCR